MKNMKKKIATVLLGVALLFQTLPLSAGGNFESTQPFIPNAFTPNGDGINDVFAVMGGPFTKFNIQIFNRWGEKVFETDQQREWWDGTFRGNPLPGGVFAYRLVAVGDDGGEYKMTGNITLIR